MAVETIAGPTRKVHLFSRQQSTPHAAATAITTHARLEGHQRVVGSVHVDQAQQTGYPRIRQSADGITWSIVTIIERDLLQADFVYPFDVDLKLPYVQIQTLQGAVDSSFIYAYGFATPVPNLELSLDLGAGNQTIESDPVTQFAAGASTGDAQTANLVGLPNDKVLIRQLGIVSTQALDFEVSLWSSDSFASATLADDTWLGSFTFRSLQANVINNLPAGTVLYRYDMSNLYFPYEDGDGTAELHVAVRPINGSMLAGTVFKLIVGLEPGA